MENGESGMFTRRNSLLVQLGIPDRNPLVVRRARTEEGEWEIYFNDRDRRSRAMKQPVFCILVCSITGLLDACSPTVETPEEMVAAAKALDQRFVEAYNRGDVNA